MKAAREPLIDDSDSDPPPPQHTSMVRLSVSVSPCLTHKHSGGHDGRPPSRSALLMIKIRVIKETNALF